MNWRWWQEAWDEADEVERGLLLFLLPFWPLVMAVFCVAYVVGWLATIPR